MTRIEVKVPQTEFELGIPEERRKLDEEKEKKAKLLEEQKEIKKGLRKAQEVLAKKKLVRKKRLLAHLKKLVKIKPKKLGISPEGRARLLRELIQKRKRPVAILRRIEDKIPNVLVKRRDEEIKPTFLKKGGLI